MHGKYISLSFLTKSESYLSLLLSFNYYKFIGGYSYFPNNSKDIKDHIWAYEISSKILFQLKIKIIATSFILIIMFVIEMVFVLEKITDGRFGDLLEIINKFASK